MKFVLGFMFSEDAKQVVLLRKSRPRWQKGLLNAPGGKVELGETPLMAVVREFGEETGLPTEPENWSHFARLQGPHLPDEEESFRVDCYYAVGVLDAVRQTEDEPPVLVDVGQISSRVGEMIPNLPWLIYMALGGLVGKEKCFAVITYR